MKMEVKRPRGGTRSKWKDAVRRDMKVEKVVEEWVTDIEKWKGIRKTPYPVQGAFKCYATQMGVGVSDFLEKVLRRCNMQCY